MFDMSWGEVMVIGGVALIVIGPKDLPKALRTVGQMTAKVRRLAGEFQTQFSEAMREAELEDVKKEMEGLHRDVSSAASGAGNFNPIQTIRDELKGAVEGTAASSAGSADWQALPEPPPVSPPSVQAGEGAPPSGGWAEYGPEKPSISSGPASVDPGTLNPGFIDPEVQPPLPADISSSSKAESAPPAPGEQRA